MHMDTQKEHDYYFPAHRKNKDHMELLISAPLFQEKVAEIRNKYQSSLEDLGDKIVCDVTPQFNDEVTKLCERFRLTKNFDQHVERYILEGSASAPLTNYKVGIGRKEAGFENQRYLTVEIYSVLTDAELTQFKDELQNFKAKIPTFQPIKDLKWKLESERLLDKCAELNTNPDKEYKFTIRSMKGSKLRAKEAYEHRRELKDLRKKRFGI